MTATRDGFLTRKDVSVASGQRLRRCREALGLSLRDVTQELRFLNVTSLHYVEAGRSLVPVDVLYDLSKKYDISMEWVVSGDEDIEPMWLKIVERSKAYKENYK